MGFVVIGRLDCGNQTTETTIINIGEKCSQRNFSNFRSIKDVKSPEYIIQSDTAIACNKRGYCYLISKWFSLHYTCKILLRNLFLLLICFTKCNMM